MGYGKSLGFQEHSTFTFWSEGLGPSPARGFPAVVPDYSRIIWSWGADEKLRQRDGDTPRKAGCERKNTKRKTHTTAFPPEEPWHDKNSII